MRYFCCAVLLASTAFAQTTVNSLQQLVEHALQHNPDLLAVRQRLAEAQGLLRQAGLKPNPALDVSVGNGDLLASRGERQIELGYSHILELGGKRERRVEAAQLETELAVLEVANRERLLRAQVRSRYIEALAAMRNLGNAQRALELTAKSRELAEARVREGEGAPLEQSLLQVEANRVDADRVLFQGQVERVVLDLNLLAGMDEGGTLRVAEPLAAPALAPNAGELARRALAGRPDIQAARMEERIAEAQLRLAQSQASPDVVLTGRYAHVQSRFEQPFPLRDRDNLLTAGVSISLPVRNRNQGNIEAAVARSRAVRLRREALERSVRNEVLAAVNRYEATRGALGIFAPGVVEQSQENLRVVRGAYELGELRLLDVINEQRRLLEAQRAYTDLLKDANIAVAELERALGAPLE